MSPKQAVDAARPGSPSRAVLWTGRVLSAIPALLLLISATMKLGHGPALVEAFTQKFGFSEGALTPIAILEVACAVLYLIPQTAVFGAILVAAYLGGATCTHVRVGDPSAVMPVVLGILAWLGLYLRDERLRALVPLRRTSRGHTSPSASPGLAGDGAPAALAGH